MKMLEFNFPQCNLLVVVKQSDEVGVFGLCVCP